MASTQAQQPADTSMMGVVHSALRRDLVRARLVASGDDVPSERRKALGQHLLWMMSFLHHHHEGEDEGLYPLVVRHNPDAAELVAAMDSEHAAILPAITSLELAATGYRDSVTGSQERLLTALEGMDEVLLPHLSREETEMMPVVSASLTDEQWSSWDLATNVKPKSFGQLGVEGHWLLDGADATARARIVSLVPALPRFVLLHGFRAAYARKTRSLWAGTRAAEVPALTLDNFDQWARS